MTADLSSFTNTNASLPEFAAATIELVGQGDYCRAYSVDREWIFLVARHAEAARRFVEYCRSEEGMRVFRRFGFAPSYVARTLVRDG